MISKENLQQVGAKFLKLSMDYPYEEWELNGRKIYRVLCCCCVGVIIWDWDEPWGRTDELRKLLKACNL